MDAASKDTTEKTSSTGPEAVELSADQSAPSPITTTSPTTIPLLNEGKIPDNKVNLRLLLTNGKRADFMFDSTTTVEQIKKSVFDTWPKGMGNFLATLLAFIFLTRHAVDDCRMGGRRT
jgi:hypothetical protein